MHKPRILPTHLSQKPNTAAYFVTKYLDHLNALRARNTRDLQRIKDLCREWEQLPELDNINNNLKK